MDLLKKILVALVALTLLALGPPTVMLIHLLRHLLGCGDERHPL